jgi:hypothetical protein
LVAAEGAAGNNALRAAAEGAYETISAVGKAGVLVAPVAFAYVAITRPQLVASAGGWIAEQLGANRLVGIYAVYIIGIFWSFNFCARFGGAAASLESPSSALLATLI